MADQVRVGIAGVTGRMGGALVHAALNTPGIMLGAASSRSENELVIGQDAGLLVNAQRAEVAVSGSLGYCQDSFDVAIDFTNPEHTVDLARLCSEHGKGLVIGTTAHTPEQREVVQQCAKDIAIVMSPNMSVGINLMLKLLEDAAQILGPNVDTDISEVHHRGKRDVPSGTSLALGQAVASGRGQKFPECASFEALVSDQERDPATLQFHALRQADVIGEHKVSFALPGERLELAHIASSREIYASGAMRAAMWVAKRSPGLYTMRDVLSQD